LRKSPKIMVIGIDGAPYSFLKLHKDSGELPFIRSMIDDGSFIQTDSVIPTISSVAWASYMTGLNPGGHGIYGFVDRTSNPFEMYIPTGNNLKAKTIWQILSSLGKRVIVVNVPVTYPPKSVNGIMVAGFLATNVRKATYPPEVANYLEEIDYRVDVDSELAHRDLGEFLVELDYVLQKRLEAALHFIKNYQWDFFQLHIMETDRINHFLFRKYADKDPIYYERFMGFYRKLDAFLGEIRSSLPEGCEFIVLSDHGFCPILKEVNINRFLMENNYLKFTGSNKPKWQNISRETKAYSLIPGRIYINLKGREAMGSVKPGRDYDRLRDELVEALTNITDPQTGAKISQRVFKREDLYSGKETQKAADIIIQPSNGYEIKASLEGTFMADPGKIKGMHTFHDAALIMSGKILKPGEHSIIDLFPTIMKMMGIRFNDCEGNSLI